MKKRIRESGRKLLAYHKLGRAQKYTVIVSTLLTDCWPHTYVPVRIPPQAEKHVLCMYAVYVHTAPSQKTMGLPNL